MKIKSIGFFILVLLICVLVFTKNARRAEAICESTMTQVVDVLTQLILNAGSPADLVRNLGRVMQEIQKYGTLCDSRGNPVTGMPYPTDSINLTPEPTRSDGTPAPTLRPVGGTSNVKSYGYAEQISPLIAPCKMWDYNGFCRHVNTVIGDGIESRYREGLSDGFGNSTTGRYWCATYTEDVVRMALGRNINVTESVIGQTSAWRSNNFPYFPYYQGGQEKSILQTIQPGCLMFQMESVTVHQPGNQHVAVVKAVELNNFGDGKIVTLDANGPVRESQYTVQNWDLYKMVGGVKKPITPWLKTNLAFGCLP